MYKYPVISILLQKGYCDNSTNRLLLINSKNNYMIQANNGSFLIREWIRNSG